MTDAITAAYRRYLSSYQRWLVGRGSTEEVTAKLEQWRRLQAQHEQADSGDEPEIERLRRLVN